MEQPTQQGTQQPAQPVQTTPPVGQQPTQQQAQTTPATGQPVKKKKWWIWFIIAIVVLAIVLGLFLWIF